MNDEIVQYFVVNSELGMSAGKIAAQVGHVATIMTHDVCLDLTSVYSDSSENNTLSPGVEKWREWYYNNQPKIILRAKEKDLLKLIDQGWYYIRDNGRTEIPENSLTVVGCAPNYKSELQKIVKRFQVL